MSALLSYGYPAVLVAGLIAAIRWRHRLGSAAGPAVAGFAVLVAHFVAQQWWDDAWAALVMSRVVQPGHPDLTLSSGLIIGGVALAAGKAAGLLLLVAAVVRGRRKPQVLVHDKEVAGRG
jgi:hypothetical protein